MQVFEFHFNPKVKSDLTFESFCYEPENIYEKRVGSLYLVGLLRNVLPKNLRFLNSLARTIKERYYRLTLKNPEKALKESLKEANSYLENMAKSGDVSWLGNLNFAALSFKNFEMNFTKAGEMKIFLLRKGKVIDIDRKLKFQEITPWPLKIFGNIASGKLAEEDVVLVLTKEVSDFFQNQNIIEEIARIVPFNERRLKEIFKSKGEDLLKLSGILLIIFLKKELLTGKRETISPQLYPKEFSLKQAFLKPLRQNLRKWLFQPIVNFFKKMKAPGLPSPAVGKKIKLLKFPKLKFPKLPSLNKNLILTLAFISFLTLGFFVFQQEEKQKLENYQVNLSQIEEKVSQAENFLIFKEGNPTILNKVNVLLKESRQDILPLVKISPNLPEDFKNQIAVLEDRILKHLYQLNNLTEILEPELIFEANQEEFIPQRIIFSNGDIYSFSSYTQKLFKINQNGESQIIPTDKKFNLGGRLNGAILFFSKPNQLTVLKDGEFSEFSLEKPNFDFNFDRLSFYKSGLYFLDRASGEIIKYPYLGNFKWGLPQLWLSKKATENLSMAVDGSVWILSGNNLISRYYGGNFQETLKLDFFPNPESISKIFTSPALSYLYLLEPSQKRIIILNKSGKIIEQFQSKKFDSLLDFTVSEDGKTIYLLNGLKIYKISL